MSSINTHNVERLLDIIRDYLIENYLPERFKKIKGGREFNKKDLEFFARGVAELSALFTFERGRLPDNYLNRPELRSGYLLYFTATNFLKALFCLEEINAEKRFTGEVRVLDIGCGPGTSLLAAAQHFRDRLADLRLFGLEKNGRILSDATRLIGAFSNGAVQFTPIKSSLSVKTMGQDFLRRPFDIIFLSNVINEFRSMEDRLSLLSKLTRDILKENGYLIVIEPALQKTTRDLMILRDELLERFEGKLVVSSLCTHNAPCPMLRQSRRDWCHMYLAWERPHLIAAIDEMIGNRKDYLKFAYFIFSKNSQAATDKNLYRVVSSHLNSAGKSELLICGEEKIRRLVRFDKDKDAGVKIFDTLERGDLIRYEGPDRIGAHPKIQHLS